MQLDNMWQSRVEIEDYSVAYFDRITVFKVLLLYVPVKYQLCDHQM